MTVGRMLGTALTLGLLCWYAIVVAVLCIVLGMRLTEALYQAPSLVGGGILAAGLILGLVFYGLDMVVNSQEHE